MTTRAARFFSLAATLAAALPVMAQGRGGPPPGPPPRTIAPIDLTGTWVSVVIEDWRLRMMTPRKGDFEGIPMNAAARKVADSWNPAADDAAGMQCRGYGAPAVMRLPGRARISWEDDATLKIEYDAGQQTRLLRFGPPAPAGEPSWQGVSVAEWEELAPVLPRGGGAPPGGTGGGPGGAPPGGPGGGGPFAGPGGPRGGGRGGFGPELSRSLKVVTRNLRPGYLRKNGVPYSANAVLTEYFDLRTERNGETWFTVVTIVDDPANLNGTFISSSDFKKEPDASKWEPTPCSTR
jgi:hypothetical protein